MKKAIDIKFYSRAKESIEKYLLQLIIIFLILVFGIIVYSNFKENVDIDSLYYFRDFLIAAIIIILGVLMIIFGILEDLLFVFSAIFVGIIIYFIICRPLYQQALNYISNTRNKKLKPTLLIKKIIIDILYAFIVIIVFYIIVCLYSAFIDNGF